VSAPERIWIVETDPITGQRCGEWGAVSEFWPERNWSPDRITEYVRADLVQPSQHQSDPVRRLKEMLFEFIRRIEAGEIPQEDQSYGGVLMSGERYAWLSLSFHEQGWRPDGPSQPQQADFVARVQPGDICPTCGFLVEALTEEAADAVLGAFEPEPQQADEGDDFSLSYKPLSRQVIPMQPQQAGVTEAALARARAAYDAAYSAETERAGYRWEACHLAGIAAALSARDYADEATAAAAEIARLTGENEALRGERDRQYDENVELIAKNEALRAKAGRLLDAVHDCTRIDDYHGKLAPAILSRIAALDAIAQQEEPK
jgi:hypothetical protein